MKSKPDFKNCHESCFTFNAYRMQKKPSLDPPKQMKAAATSVRQFDFEYIDCISAGKYLKLDNEIFFDLTSLPTWFEFM